MEDKKHFSMLVRVPNNKIFTFDMYHGRIYATVSDIYKKEM